jgi:DNA-directed RNA polymerase specialized sigma24 family protein
MPFFLRHAASACCYSPASQDTCQVACLKAVEELPRMPSNTDFRSWVLGFIHNEARHYLRHQKNVGTCELLVGISTLETMSVQSGIQSEADLNTILGLLRETIRLLPPCLNETAVLMLQHYANHRELPPVREIAAVNDLTLGTAERYRHSVLEWFRRTLVSLRIQ